MKKKIKILIALIVGFALAMLLMSVAIYFGYTNAYSTDVNTLTVKILGIPIYELTKSGTEYIGKSIGVYMGAVCGICMAISVGTLFDGFDCLCCVKQEPKYPMFCS